MAAIAVPNRSNHILRMGDPDMDEMEISIASATEMFHNIASQTSHTSMASVLPPWQDPADRPLDMEAIDRSMTFHPSFGYTISVGTVTMDFKANKVLTIWNKKLKIFQLPKGRKNIGEGMLDGAIRETYEETGVRVHPLPLKISTRATLKDGDENGTPAKGAKKSSSGDARCAEQRIRRSRPLPRPAIGCPGHQEHVLLRSRVRTRPCRRKEGRPRHTRSSTPTGCRYPRSPGSYDFKPKSGSCRKP